MTYNITLTVNHQSLTAKYLPLAAESVQYLTAKVVYETDDWTGREIKAMFEHGHTVYEVPVTGGEITAKQQLNLTAGDWRVWLIGNSARDGDVIPRITTNIAHIIVAPTGGTEGSPFPATPPTVEEQLRADMGNLADLTTEDKSSLVAAINEVRQTGGGGVQSDWNQNDETAADYVKNRPFYTGDPVETVLVEESTVSFVEDSGLYFAEFESTFEATVGETYKVYWDGTTYECACVNFNNIPAIGNLSIAGAGSDTGEPFLMGVDNGRIIDIATQNTSASHTISISGLVSEVVKIDPKYLPDTIATKSEVEAAQTTANNAQTTAYNALTTANNAKTTANNAKTAANNAQTTANNAQTTANNAQTTADDAKTTANNAKTTADDAKTTANNAKTAANNAKTAANNAQTTANNAQTTANNAKSEALDLAARMFGHTSVVDNAFYRDETLSITSLPACIESIGDGAFARCINLALTSLPSGLTSIGDQAFTRCINLALTSLPSGLTSIGAFVFAECTNLALTSLPSGLTSIGFHAFTDCTNLALTSLPSGLTSIGDQAFAGCTNLALTSLPSGLTSIGDGAFADCTNLALTSLPSGLTSIGDSMFLRCINLALTSLPSGLTSIGSFVFAECTNLALTSLPSGLTSIGEYAFRGCTGLALTSLPSGMTSIDSRAFQSCTGLTSITFTGKPTTINSAAFEGCTNLTTINVPWAEGEVANAPWGATNATINYNYTEA